jgi:cell division protein ZapA
MDRRTVELRIAGQSYRVVSSADEPDLHRLAETVSAKIAEVARGKPAAPQAMLLAAMSLAHELEAERARRQALEKRTRELLRRVLGRLDDALDEEEDGEEGVDLVALAGDDEEEAASDPLS